MKVGLVLSGGAMYGLAHIGVLKALEKANIKIDIITGASMGAIIGGLYSCGVSTKEMDEILQNFSMSKIIDFSIFGIRNKGLVNGAKAIDFFESIIGKKRIEKQKIKFACVATDLKSGKEYHFKKGKVSIAMRASMSVPALFKPVELSDMVLVDGGLVNNLPVDLARSMGADVVISVDVCSFYKSQNELKSPLDILLSSSNLALSKMTSVQKDKGDICIMINSVDIPFEKFSYEFALKSISLGETETTLLIKNIQKLVKKRPK